MSNLQEKYPKIFNPDAIDGRYPFPMFGLELPPGWTDLVDHLCYQIQQHIDNREQQIKWALKYNEQEDLAYGPREVPESVPQVHVTQVKEKFGTLRFYYNGGDDTIDGMVYLAESLSGIICETCGNKGKRRGGGWVRTLCDEHAKEAGIYVDDEV